MIAKTGKQLAGTKQNGRRKPVTETTKTSARKSKEAVAETAVAKAGKAVGQKSGTKSVSVKNSAGQKPKRVKSAVADTEGSATASIDASSEVETAEVERSQNVGANENGGDDPDKTSNGTSGTGNANGTSEPVRPLTEAGKKRLVNKLLGLADSQATQGTFKITPADLIRLMQLHREMNPQKDRKVTVQWIEDKPE